MTSSLSDLVVLTQHGLQILDAGSTLRATWRPRGSSIKLRGSHGARPVATLHGHLNCCAVGDFIVETRHLAHCKSLGNQRRVAACEKAV
jgi:hypothetical protein